MLDLLEMEDVINQNHRADSVLLAEAETHRQVSRFTYAMWVAVLVLALFNSAQLMTVVNGLRVGPVQDAIVALSTTWNEQAEKNGLDKPVAYIRLSVQSLRDVTWPVRRDAIKRGAQSLSGS
mgnify:FL=1